MWKDKLSSGRFWLAVMTGLVFIITSIGAFGAPQLTQEQVTGVIMLVFVSYFNKQKDPTSL